MSHAGNEERNHGKKRSPRRPSRKVGRSGGEIATALTAAVALAVSIWSVIEARSATEQSRWTDFRATTLSRLSDQARAYNRAACILRVAGLEKSAAHFDGPIRRIGEIERDLHNARAMSGEKIAQFEAMHDASRDVFRRLDQEADNFTTLLKEEELERAEKVCGYLRPQ